MKKADTLSAQLFKQLHNVRDVQRRLELLKPIIDKAADELQAMAVLVEQMEKERKAKQ